MALHAERSGAAGRTRGLRRLVAAARHDRHQAGRLGRHRTAAVDSRDARKALRRSGKAAGESHQDLAAVSRSGSTSTCPPTRWFRRVSRRAGWRRSTRRSGHFDLAPDQALVITIPQSDAPYLGFQLGSLWYISLDYINHQTSLNATQAQVDPDGKIRIVVADRSPGVTNWVETLGHRKGFLQFRWQRVSRELTDADGPTVANSSISTRCPPRCRSTSATRSPTKTGVSGLPSGSTQSPRECWGKPCRRACWRARWCASAVSAPRWAPRWRGAAPRTAPTSCWRRAPPTRLDDVAKQIADTGRRAVAVRPTSPTTTRSRTSSTRRWRRTAGRRADQQRVSGAVDETVGRHHVPAHPRRDRTDRARRPAADPGLHARARRGRTARS